MPVPHCGFNFHLKRLFLLFPLFTDEETDLERIGLAQGHTTNVCKSRFTRLHFLVLPPLLSCFLLWRVMDSAPFKHGLSPR